MKKTLLVSLSLVLIAALAIGMTLAYLTDTDEAVNVMTMGNVSIVQNEQQRVDDKDNQTKLETFDQNQPLLPAHFEGTSIPWAPENEWVVAGNQAWKVVEDNENVIDKFVTVTNTGKTNAYVRTVFAIEVGPDAVNSPFVHYVTNGTNIKDADTWEWEWVVDENGEDVLVEIDGNYYLLWVATYTGELAPKTTTIPSLKQIYMNKAATNEDVAKYGDTYEILAFSQAVQADGFTDPATALNTAFGAVSGDNHPWSDKKIVSASTPEELKSAVENATEPTTILLADGNYTTNFKIPGGKDITITGSENTVLSGQIATTASNAGTLTLKGVTVKVDSNIKDSTGISQTGKSAIALWGDQTVICENVTFDMSLSDSSAISAWWDTGAGTSVIVKNCVFNCNGQRPIRATGNVTVENCTFNDPYRYAVQLTAKTSTANLMDKAIINFNNNTIVNGENGKAYVYGIQLEGETYGCKDCVINGTGNTIENGGTESTMYYCECGKVDHATIEWNTEVDPVHAN